MATKGYYTEGKIVNGTNVGGGTFVPESTPSPTPTEPTAGTVYKSFTAPQAETAGSVGTAAVTNRSWRGSDGNYYTTDSSGNIIPAGAGAVNENEIRSRVLGMFQNEINAQNQIYAEKLAEAKQAGLGRLGSARATQARSGLLGSDFAGAQNDKVNTANASIEASINAEKAAKIASIMGLARQEAATEIANKRAAQQQGLDKYLEYLGKRTEEKKSNVSKLAASILDQGLTPENINPQQLIELAASYGVSTGDITAAFNAEKKIRDEAQAKTNLEKRKQDALEKYQNGQLSIDQYNAETARINAETARGKAGLDENGNPLPASSSALEQQALTSAQDLLVKFDKGVGTSAVGKSGFLGSLGFGLIPGTDRADFVAQFENFKANADLNNAKYLKGSGAVSDAERALLSNATKLSLKQSEPEFRKSLKAQIVLMGGTTPVTLVNPVTGETQQVNATKAGVEQAIKDGLTVEYQ